MTDSGDTWQPQPRPEWVARLNTMGRAFGSPELLVPLDEQSLIAAASAATGLDDFGPDEWREPFRLLLDDMANESELTLTGRIMARFDLMRSLTARLGMAEAERMHPEITEQPVEAPIIITGLGRTGTSILHELLAQDPALRAPLGWELRYPAPPPEAATRATDPRIATAAADIDFWTDVVPEFLAMHESTSEGPDEDTAGLFHEFITPAWSATHRAPNYDNWIMGANEQTARFHRRLLQHLQWRTPGRWIVKAPTHLSMLPELFAVYPDAQVIHTHRDPLKALASTADMVTTLRWQRSDRTDYDEFAQMMGFGFPFLLDYVIEQRSTGVVPADRFVDARYADLIEDPISAVGHIYERLDMELTDDTAARIRAYLDARPQGRHGGHSYRFEHLGLDEGEMRTKFAAYMDHYGVPQEQLWSDPTTADLDAAWQSYSDRMKAAGERITEDAFPSDARLHAEGYRYIKRIQNLAHQIYVEFPSTTWPMLFRYGDDVTPFGATNTDNNYYRAMVDPAGTYCISGDVSGVKELLFSVQDGEFVFGKVEVLAEAGLEDLDIAADGRLELILGGPERPTNWLPLAPEAEYINVREFVADWEADALAVLHIERVDDVPPVPDLSPAAMIVALDQAASWVEASVRVWNEFAAGARAVMPVNELPPPMLPTGGAANMLHGATQWDLGADQALVAEFDQPEVTYWSIQTYVLDWLQPLDFVNRVTSLNDGQLAVDDDGKVRIVLAHRDPGVANWLDTSGLQTGLMSYRYVKATVAPAPRTALIDLAAVRTYLPASTPSFSAEDRRAQIAARRRGIARRFRR